MAGVGKSAISRRIAQMLGVDVVDIDANDPKTGTVMLHDPAIEATLTATEERSARGYFCKDEGRARPFISFCSPPHLAFAPGGMV